MPCKRGSRGQADVSSSDIQGGQAEKLTIGGRFFRRSALKSSSEMVNARPQRAACPA